MSRTDLIKTMAREIANLNQEIDLRIIKGLSYRREAKRHRFLSRQLRDLQTVGEGASWTSRVFALTSTFLF